MATEADQSTLLELDAMTRAFPGVLANDRVDLSVHAGQVHALLGENGAGKSTLVKMIYGILKPDSGTIRWQGQPVEVVNPAFARQLGIAMVFQHFSLFDSLTVFENIILGMDAATDGTKLRAEISDISTRYGLPLDPDRHVYTLSVGERQRIEIIRCLLQRPKMLVMDEPTSVLTPQEVERLFETLERLADEGLGILYISHKLDEIKRLCRKATILRDGKVVASVDVESETPASLASLMMGQDLAQTAERPALQAGEVRIAVDNLSLNADDEFGIPLRDIHFAIRAGEILGIAGVAGNGQDELLQALSGESPTSRQDAIKIDGTPCGNADPNQRRLLGMSSIPEERLGHGAVPAMSLNDNALLTAFQRLKLVSGGFIKGAATRQFSDQIMQRFNVKANGIDAHASSLSGGNLQKFIVGREICQQPEVLVVSQPTWGVDAGAAQTIHSALRELAANGSAVLVISQDLDELIKISDRIAAICAGKVSAAYETVSISVEQIGLLMTGASTIPALEQGGDAHV